MKSKPLFILLASLYCLLILSSNNQIANETILSYTVNCNKQNIQLYWKDDTGHLLNSIQNLKSYLDKKNEKLVFAMNAGMYKKDFSPQGLFIHNYKTITAIDLQSGNGNFYLKPNGIFYITKENIPYICKSEDFKNTSNIKLATQSGPMLLINGKIHDAFKEGSTNLNIRNGVGILPNNEVVFAMSKQAINFYDFAKYFQNLGCKNALYLDGFVSRTYLPEKNWVQTDGNFGVMIGVTENNK